MKEKIIKISFYLSLLFAAALPVMAVTITPTPTYTPVCMASAVEKRDTAMITAVDKYHSSVMAALKTRKDALKSAWGISDTTARKNAVTAAWNTFNATWKKADQELKSSRKTAWSQFIATRKTCHAPPWDEHDSKGKDKKI